MTTKRINDSNTASGLFISTTYYFGRKSSHTHRSKTRTTTITTITTIVTSTTTTSITTNTIITISISTSTTNYPLFDCIFYLFCKQVCEMVLTKTMIRSAH